MDIQTQADDIINRVKIDELEHTANVEIKFLRVSDVTEALSIVLTGICTILAFATGYYKYSELSLTAGLIGTLSSTLLIYSRYSYKEAQEREKRIDKIIQSIKKNNFEFLLRNSPSESLV